MSRISGVFIQSLLFLIILYAFSFAGWTEPVRIGIPGGYQYPQILAAGDTLHVVGTLLPGGDKVVYLRSDDSGESWTDGQVLSDTINSTNAMFVRIVRYEQNLIVFWRSILNTGPRPWNVGYSLSHDNGESWTEPLYIINPGWDHILYFSASSSGPAVNVIASRRVSPDLIFYNIRSTNFGENWSEPVEIFRAAQSSMTDQVSFVNSVHFSWGGRFDYENRWETYYMKSADNGISWSENILMSEEDEYPSYFPSLWVDGQGNLSLSWFDYRYSPYFLTGDILFRRSTDGGDSWSPEQQITFDHLAMVISDVVANEDTINIAWEDEGYGLTGRSIFIVRSKDAGMTWSDQYWLDGTDDDSWNPAVAASNGRVYVVWSDDRPDPGIGLYFSRYQDQTDANDEPLSLPERIVLYAYPNPFNSEIIFSLNMLEGGEAEINIYNIEGRLVKTLFKGGIIEKGWHKFTWDATEASGKAVSSGLYFAVASTPRGKISKALTLIR